MVATIVPKKTKTFTIPFPVETSVRKDLTSLFNSFILSCIVFILSAQSFSCEESLTPADISEYSFGVSFFLGIMIR